MTPDSRSLKYGEGEFGVHRETNNFGCLNHVSGIQIDLYSFEADEPAGSLTVIGLLCFETLRLRNDVGMNGGLFSYALNQKGFGIDLDPLLETIRRLRFDCPVLGAIN